MTTSTAVIAAALADHKRAGAPFPVAWRTVVGEIPPHAPNGSETHEWFVYLALKACYEDANEFRSSVEPDTFAGDGLPARGKSLGVVA